MAGGKTIPLRTASSEDLRSEYAAITSYVVASVGNRFTTTLLYLTASGFLANATFKDDHLSRTLHVLLGLFGCVVSICMWFLELRTRQLLSVLTSRGKYIETQCWGLDESGAGAGFFTGQMAASSTAKSQGHRWDANFSIFGISGSRLPVWFRSRITHSFGFDLLYCSGAVMWFTALCAVVF